MHTIREAYRYFAHRVFDGEQGVFFSVQERDGSQQFWMGFQPDDSGDFEFFYTDFLGEKHSRVSFSEIYTDTVPEVLDASPLPDIAYDLPDDLSLLSNETAEQFRANVDKVKAYARAGNLWVLNLAHKLKGSDMELAMTLKSYENFLALEKHHCAGVWWTDDRRFVSFSPETFVQQHNGIIDTYPIKGTGSLEYLQTSEKEKSELMMVTDLLRNDLGKIAHKVCVPEVRTYTHEGDFYHAMAHIQATLPGTSLPWETYLELLPAGSISGAPKHRVCQYIQELEKEPRDLYTGTFGVRKSDGSFLRSNILIRTLFLDDDGTWSFPVGGGITYESDPESEWYETLKKAEILRLVSHTQ